MYIDTDLFVLEQVRALILSDNPGLLHVPGIQNLLHYIVYAAAAHYLEYQMRAPVQSQDYCTAASARSAERLDRERHCDPGRDSRRLRLANLDSSHTRARKLRIAGSTESAASRTGARSC